MDVLVVGMNAFAWNDDACFWIFVSTQEKKKLHPTNPLVVTKVGSSIRLDDE